MRPVYGSSASIIHPCPPPVLQQSSVLPAATELQNRIVFFFLFRRNLLSGSSKNAPTAIREVLYGTDDRLQAEIERYLFMIRMIRSISVSSKFHRYRLVRQVKKRPKSFAFCILVLYARFFHSLSPFSLLLSGHSSGFPRSHPRSWRNTVRVLVTLEDVISRTILSEAGLISLSLCSLIMSCFQSASPV